MAVALAPGVSRKLKKVLETRTDSPDLLASLGALSTFYVQNTPQARRNLKSSIEQRSLAINRHFLDASLPAHKALDRVETEVHALNDSWKKIEEALDSCSVSTGDIISTTERLQQELEVITQRQEIVTCFLRDYQLTNEEINALREEEIDEKFFKALLHVQEIHSNCKVLLRTHHQVHIEIGNYGGLEKEVETLKRDKTLLMQQLVDLRHYQQSSSLELQNLIQRLHVMEQNQQQMMALLAIVVQNPDFLNQLVQQQRRSNWLNDDGSNKRRFIALERGPAAEQETSGAGAPIIQYRSPVPEVSNQTIPENGVFCPTPVQPVSSPALAMPMDAETTSNNVDTLGLTDGHFTGTSGLCDWDDVDMDTLFNGLDFMDIAAENDGQMEFPLSVDDYQQLEQGNQMEAQQNCDNPQYGTKKDS